MVNYKKTNAIFVLTSQSVTRILTVGGSREWVIDPKRALKRKYVVCVKNRDPNDKGGASAMRHRAFLVGRLKDLVPVKSDGGKTRWILTFSEYAEIDVPDAWAGFRNPIFYSDLESLGIDVSTLKFEPMPEQEPGDEAVMEMDIYPLTLAEAKVGLALTFGVKPLDIEITVRG